jgi:hypothetical protein
LIESEEIRLHPNDGESVVQWVEHLRKAGEILAFKSGADPAPKGSGLAVDSFVLMIQTRYQKEVFEKYGHAFVGIDATHNTTHYENMSLFTVIVRDHWGHGEILLLRGTGSNSYIC